MLPRNFYFHGEIIFKITKIVITASTNSLKVSKFA